MSLSCLASRSRRTCEGDRPIRGSLPPVRLAWGAALVAATVLPGSSTLAGGLWLYEMGTPDLGTASAGRAASAKDAATVFGNPAGMTSLDRSQLLVGTDAIDIRMER